MLGSSSLAAVIELPRWLNRSIRFRVLLDSVLTLPFDLRGSSRGCSRPNSSSKSRIKVSLFVQTCSIKTLVPVFFGCKLESWFTCFSKIDRMTSFLFSSTQSRNKFSSSDLSVKLLACLLRSFLLRRRVSSNLRVCFYSESSLKSSKAWKKFTTLSYSSGNSSFLRSSSLTIS
jgi:hypothetical protein